MWATWKINITMTLTMDKEWSNNERHGKQ